ncbi:transcription elongation factor GreA [Candidatus Falkowbacteria bacterium]|nr:transcription elongation factor GreA [Candidatus Falkowbacteria bacterium]
MSTDEFIVTQEGLDKLQQELTERLVKRITIADKIEYAKNLGDLSENFEYQEAKDDQVQNESRVAELEYMIKRCTVKAKDTAKGAGISLGSKITARVNGTLKEFQVVSFNESDPAKGKISNESPLGVALLGKKSGETVSVATPRGTTMEYEIVDIG